jgi:hypothetical protein
MREAAVSGHPNTFPESLASRLLDFHKTQARRTTNGGGFSHAVRACERCADAPGGVEVWKYAFPLAANQPVEDLRVRCTTAAGWLGLRDTQWTGIFACARGRYVDVLPWPAANAVVVAAANAVYIVDPRIPEQFSGFAARVEINDVTFDELGEHLFVADSRRIFAFSSDRLFRWISEPLEGYGARFRRCGGRVLTVELKQFGPDPEGEEAAPLVIRLRTEDGTILRSRFRLVHRYWEKSGAA